jgi:putative multiple sugar transport system substrate-binding protein
MKKFALMFCLAAAVTCFVTACGDSSSKTAGKDQKGASYVGVAMPTQSLQRWNQDGANLKKQLEGKGFKVDLQYANNDVNTQLQQIENMITKGVNVLVIASIDGSALTDVLRKAADAHIKIIAYDRLIKNSPNVDYYVTFDNYTVGVIQGTYLVDKLGLKDGKGPFNIEFFAGSPDDNNALYFFNGAISQLQPYLDSGKLVVPSGQKEFNKVATYGWESAKAQARMDNLITAHYSHAKLDAVLCSNDSVAIGVVSSLQSAGYGQSGNPYPVVTGQDCDKPNVIAMIHDQQSMSVFKDTRVLADKTVEMVEALLQGKEAEVNDTKTYNNGVKVVPSFLCKAVFADKNNYKELLIDSGYYKASELQPN